ncbi:hypothetical protein MPSEU_000996700 [Mayamaea pseudoterrestris]|nr:hypothetical protein MPSEU_000996700 [Mayamaea pseudoterrestris]
MLESTAGGPLLDIEDFDDNEVDLDEDDDIRIPLVAAAANNNNLPTMARLPPPPANANATTNNAAAAITNNNTPPLQFRTTEEWREAERRQRTIRVLIMFLLMLLVMDGDHDEANQRLRSQQQNGPSRLEALMLEPRVFAARQKQDASIQSIVQNDVRFHALIKKNQNIDMQQQVLQWAQKELDSAAAEEPPLSSTEGLTKDEFPGAATADESRPSTFSQQQPPLTINEQQHDAAEDQKVFHYPWNTTGFYRGQWSRNHMASAEGASDLSASPLQNASTPARLMEPMTLDAISLESTMLQRLKETNDTSIGVFVLPHNQQVLMRDDHNFTSNRFEQVTVDASGKTYPPEPTEEPTAAVSRATTEAVLGVANAAASVTMTAPVQHRNTSVTLTRASGRVAFQLFSRKIPTLRELSLVDGFVKLYDSDHAQGYSTRQDVLLRVKGVLVHGIGRLSLVANTDVRRSVLVIGSSTSSGSNATISKEVGVASKHQRRRLQEALSNMDAADMTLVRQDAEALYRQQPKTVRKRARKWLLKSPELMDRKLLELPLIVNQAQSEISTESENVTIANTSNMTNVILPPWSDVVLPYPFTRDDQHESIRKTKTPAARRMPPREQVLEANALDCEFEINMNVQEVEWTLGAWRNLVLRRLKEARLLNPFLARDDAGSEKAVDTKRSSRSRASSLSARERAKLLQDQAVVMSMVGVIESRNCHFSANLNATAIRTDWDATTSKAINYSFYMMLVCLTQILILLRQLLYSQSQSAATKVSLLCVGWQTVIDALVCLAHIYLSLAMTPLFAAFASVAFFKLLIFCVIEMKYMAMIIQARNNSNGGGQSQEALRRQVAVLHLRFYITLFSSFFLAFYVGEKYRTLYALLLYSFWVPQIVLNVITETKKPLHKYYVYGMSLTRLVAPLYIFGLPNNFLKEVYPDSPTDPVMCELLIGWVAVQTAILVAQGKYGARFMIPARFLPPKFDYNRPLPASMLPPSSPVTPKPESIEEDHRGSSPISFDKDAPVQASDPLPARARHATAPTTRNRLRGLRWRSETSSTMTAETVVTQPVPPAQACTLDCSICYDGIDACNRSHYMLAPCNHLFHRDCLIQWMEIKMECPICRTTLPAL